MTEKQKDNESQDMRDLKVTANELLGVRMIQGLAWAGWFLIGVPALFQMVLDYNINKIPVDLLPVVNHQILGSGLVVLTGYALLQLLLVIWNLDVVNHQDLITWRLKKVLGAILIAVGFEGFNLIDNAVLNGFGAYIAGGCGLVYLLARLGNRQLTNQVAHTATMLSMTKQKSIKWSQYQLGMQKVVVLDEINQQPTPSKWWQFNKKKSVKKVVKVHQP